jgi:aminoglycoside phosphotransferase (APT) family kinase protein
VKAGEFFHVPRNPAESQAKPQFIPTELIVRLLELRAPLFAHLGIGGRYDDADDHCTVRLGDFHGASFPTVVRQPSFHPVSMAHLRDVAPQWGFTAQVPIIIGEPALGYGSHFSVFEWIPASNSVRSPLTLESAFALGAALAHVHEPAPPDAPQHQDMGVPPTWQSPTLYALVEQVASKRSPGGRWVDPEAARAAWDAALEYPLTDDETWIHGGLDPRLLLSDGGRFAGITHWREFSRGDPVLDLAQVAVALSPPGIDAMLRGYGRAGDTDLAVRIRAAVVFRALTFTLSPNPALARLGWTRLSDHHVLDRA